LQHKYFLGKKIAYLFSTNDGQRLKIDIAISKDKLQDGINMMKQAYNSDITYEQITDELNIVEDLLTLEEFQRIIETSNEKNYNQFKHLITIDLYDFLKNINKQQQQF